MIGDPQQQNPLAGLMSLLGQSSAGPQAAPSPMPAPTQQPPAVPPGGAAPAQAASAPQANAMSPIVGQMMGQAQQSMQNPMGQAVPPAGGLASLAQHPLVQGIIKAIAQAAQGYGWTAMQPSERLERTQMNQQKAEALARLAETGAYQGGSLDIRERQTGINQQKADTGEERAQTSAAAQGSLADWRTFEKQNMQDKLALQRDANQWKQEMAQGRLDKAQQMIDQKASQFEQKFQLAQKQFGLEEARTAMQGEGLGIKQGMLDLARTALSQKGTVEGAQAMSKIQQFKIEHPIMSQFMDMSDIDQLIGGAGATNLPGVAPVAPSAQPTPTGVPQPGPGNKAQAKKQQAGAGSQDFGAANGKQEGSTGTLNGQRVIVRGGRIVLAQQ